MWVTGQSGNDGYAKSVGPGPQEKLDRALVAGLILEVVLDQTDLPDGPQARQRLVKRCIQEYLVRHLAGRVSLDRFRALAQNLDGWFDFFYPLLVGDGRPTVPPPTGPVYAVRESGAAYCLNEPRPERSAGPRAPVQQACQAELLDDWFEAAKTDIPHRSHRKLTPRKLRRFLEESGGRWFRLRDFERYVQMDRKTAWDYLQLFMQNGLLCHNRKNSAAVRYCLAPSFLKVEADALRLALSLCLSSYSEDLLEKVGDFLIASGGEALPLAEWEREFSGTQGRSLLDGLAACHIVVREKLPVGSGFIKLHRRWLRSEGAAPESQKQPVVVYHTSVP